MNKQAALENWLASGKPITGMLAIKMWWLIDFRKAMSRVRRHFDIEDKWVTRNGVRYKVHWLAGKKPVKRSERRRGR